MGILSAFRFAFQNLFFSPILYGVIASLAVFSTVWEQGDRLKDQLTDRFRSQDDTFDFIIVGAGSAGAVLANRLSQHHTVLLLEHGGETHPFQAIPGLSIFIPKHPGTDWMHKSVTQSKSCLACRHKKYILSQGKNLGGTGNLNYMMHLRGNPLDFENWATITADPTWGYNGVLPYFIRSENFIGKTTDENAHGTGGPLQIQIPDCIGLANEWNQAGVEMGYPNLDLNGRHSEGFDTLYYPIKHGVRQATYRAYIKPVRNRQSLLIRKFAHVNKVLIREGTNEAYGIEYDRHGHRKNAFANKEVILSAGTLQTPKLLVLSGVGQLEHLQALHIPARSVLPVGKNLQDHFSTLLGPFYINKARTVSFDRDVDKGSFVSFATSGRGPLSTTGFQATAMITSSIAKAQEQSGWPDIQLTLFGLTPHRMFYSDIGHAFGIREDILHRYYGNAEGKENAFFIMVTLARPQSKGDFCVPNKNPYRAPVIDPRYLCDDDAHDVKVMIEGIHRALFLAENSTIFRSLETTYSQKCFPGCEKYLFRSDEYFECYIRSYSVANNDHVGTCAMGQVGSPYAVVDPELQVQGIKRLRVVDASVMPTITGAPTQAATIMIAEKASALILDRWKDEAKTFYGPPGKNPGTPVSQYGPPNPNTQYGPPTPTSQYGPPTPNNQYGPPPSNQYGPPGLRPPPLAGGDGFGNYDSFSVIRDQLNPTPGGIGGNGPGPTQLIPLNQGAQTWSTPRPFSPSPSSFLGGLSSTPGTLLSPEPSVLLQAPAEIPPNGPPPFATSYQEFSSDPGPIISTATGYPVTLTLDTSRSEKTFVATNRVGVQESANETNSTGSRRGKAFDTTDAPSIQLGNQLGEGLDDEEVTTLETPSSSIFPDYFPSSSTTPSTPIKQVTTEILTQGPGFRVVRKRFRTTPRVIVHPRGHLGHQNVPRKEQPKLNESMEALFLTTSSVRPVPKEIVKIRKRRPVPYRRRTTTPIPLTDKDTKETTVFPNDLEFSTSTSSFQTQSPPSNLEIPTELKSPARKRFVRRMYARPLNFNGKKIFGGERANAIVAEATTFAPIFVTAASDVIEVKATTNNANSRGDEEEESEYEGEGPNAQEELSAEQENFTVTPSSHEEIEDEYYLDKGDTKNVNVTEDEEDQPLVIFKNIELEDADKLTRQTRSYQGNKNSKGYFEYNVLSEDNRNPVMPLDLNPIPEIIAPKMDGDGEGSGDHDEDTHKTIAIDMSGEMKEEEGDEDLEESTQWPEEYDENGYVITTESTPTTPKSKGGEEDGELDYDNIGSLTSDEISQINYSPANNSHSINFSFSDLNKKKVATEGPPVFNSTSVSVSVSFAQEQGESYEEDPRDSELTVGTTETVPTSSARITTTTRTPLRMSRINRTPIPKQSSQVGSSRPRFNFRLRNKLMRVHS